MKTTLNTPFSINPDIKGVFDADGKDLLELSDNDDAELVRVVNQHDQLVEMNQELIEALEYQITHFKELNDNEGGLRPTEVYALSMVKDAIKRAKELTK